MKYLIVFVSSICGVATIVLAIGCGSASDMVEATKTSKQLATETTGAKHQPTVAVPPGPPPTHLVVRQPRRGFGAAVHGREHLGVQFVGVNYKTGKPFEVRWTREQPFYFNIGTGEVLKGWEIGLQGMRVGGRRKLIVPSRLAYRTGTLVYVVELLSIDRPPDCKEVAPC